MQPKFKVGDRVKVPEIKRVYKVKERIFPLNEPCGWLYAVRKSPNKNNVINRNMIWYEESELSHAE